MKRGISREFSGRLTPPTDVSKKDTSGSVERGKTRYFSATGCVVEYPDRRDVFIGGSLIGSFYPGELAMRNILIVTAAQSTGVTMGSLPAAFGVGAETVRRVRNRFAEGGIEAIVKDRRGAKKRLSAAAEKRVREYFDQGLTIAEARKRIRNRASSSAVGRIHKQWKDEKETAKAEAECCLSRKTNALDSESFVMTGRWSPRLRGRGGEGRRGLNVKRAAQWRPVG